MTIYETTVNVTDAKAKFSEIASKAGYGNEIFVIEKKGKPLAVMVSYDEYNRLKSQHVPDKEDFLVTCRHFRERQKKQHNGFLEDSVNVIRKLREEHP